MLVDRKLGAVVVSMLALSGCGTAGAALGYAEGNVDQAIELKRKQSEVEARAVINVPCAMTVGAFHRELTQREQTAVAELCGGGESQLSGDGEGS